MGAKNMVIAGDYMGKPITGIGGVVQIYVDRKNYILLDKFGVDSYDVITEDTRKSAASGIARGAVGAALLRFCEFFPFACRISAKNKSTVTVAVRFKDGKNSLLEMDDKVYKNFVRAMF